MYNRTYGNEYALRPIWEGDIAYNESVMFVSEPDGSVPDAPLLYHADEVLEACAADCSAVYQEGVDFLLVDGKIRRTEGSRMPLLTYEEAYPAEQKQEYSCFRKVGGGYIACFDTVSTHFFHKHQVTFTYRHRDAYTGFIQSSKARLLPNTLHKLQSGKPTRIMFFGDSITTPANCSGQPTRENGCEPHLPSWPVLSFQRLAEQYPAAVYDNTAVGGMASPWGCDVVLEKFTPRVPDLAFIGFGMNDATGDMDPHVFAANICTIMDRARTLHPAMEFVLVATTVANPLALDFDKTQRAHEPLFLQMEREGVAVMQMTSVHESLLARKRFYDMTGNDINHPNDYLSRAYAQTVLRLLGL